MVSSATLCALGTVLIGASFTGLTVIAIMSVSVSVPSLVTTVSVSAPLKSGFPVQARPASAALICTAVPVMVTKAVPLSVTPVPAITLRMPLDTLSVVVSALLSAVRHQDAGDRQGGVLGGGLRGRHGIDWGVVRGNDIECRRCGRDGRAIRYEPSQGPLRTRVEVGGIVARRLKLDRLQQRLVVRDRTRTGEDQRMQRGVPEERNAVTCRWCRR